MAKRAKCRSKSCVKARKRRRLASSARPPPFSALYNKPCSLFERYLLEQQWLPPNEHSRFLSTLKQPLPITFRIRDEATLHEWETTYLRNTSFFRLVKKIPRPPSSSFHSWQVLPCAMDDVNFRVWLSQKTKLGFISRQEFVSMIPVFLLDIKAHHVVLDLCSSPGSKTIQALDSLYRDHESSLSSTATDDTKIATSISSPPSGYVVANEISPQRAYILAHRCHQTLSHRLQSLAITCHNACKFPDVLAPTSSSSPSQQSKQQVQQQDSQQTLKLSLFDRIICDVPCSGDGTLRKDLKVWNTWHPSYGIELHSLQLRIAKRGIAVLKMGGLMTYSTCSFHPIENEAVVSALLQTGCVEVVSRGEIKALMTGGIRYRDGLTEWKVLDDDCEELKQNDDCGQKRTINSFGKSLPSTLWPPSREVENYDYIKDSLTRCMRMVPHDNDTGGFFISS